MPFLWRPFCFAFLRRKTKKFSLVSTTIQIMDTIFYSKMPLTSSFSCFFPKFKRPRRYGNFPIYQLVSMSVKDALLYLLETVQVCAPCLEGGGGGLIIVVILIGCCFNYFMSFIGSPIYRYEQRESLFNISTVPLAVVSPESDDYNFSCHSGEFYFIYVHH